MKNNKIFFVESYSAWFCVFARTHKAARSEGVREFGRGCIKSVRLATEDEIRYFRNIKGEIGTAE